jgi:tricorn protease-like protein
VFELRTISRFVAAVLVVALWAVAPVQAAYPGANGKIYFQACDSSGCGYDIYAVNPDGSGLENITDVVTDSPGEPDNAFDPSVSADGKRMVFGVDSQATAEIWIMDTDGTDAHQLTEDNLLDQRPSISADGSRIVWNQWSPFPTYTDRDIWTMNADGSGQELLFNGTAEDYSPQFTPDGQTVVMASETGDMDIRKIPSVPAVPPLTSATGVAEDDALLESQPAVSPDGAKVAFSQTPTSSSFGPFDIYSVGIDGGATTPLFDTSASEMSPAYSPDGNLIVFSSDFNPMIGNADGSGIPVPLDLGSEVNSAGDFEWAPAPAPTTPVVDPGQPGAGSQPPLISVPAPKTSLRKHPPKRTTQRLARFAFGSDEPGSRFECKLDQKPFRTCTSPFEKKVKRGPHRFQVRAVGAQGKADLTPAVFRWKVLPAN